MTSTTHMANTSQNSATHCVPHNHPHIMFFVIWAYRLYELFPLIVTRNICAYVCVCAYIDKHNCRYRYMCITVIYTTTPVTVYNYIHDSEWHSYFLAIDLPLLILLMFATLGILYECIIIYPYNIYIYICHMVFLFWDPLGFMSILGFILIPTYSVTWPIKHGDF